MTAADADAVVRLWTVAGLMDPDAAGEHCTAVHDKLAHHPQLFLLAEEGGAPSGTAMGSYDGHRAYIDRLAVDRSRRRRGVGRALVHELERRFSDLGARRVRVLVLAHDAGALAFWAAMGYPGVPAVRYCAKTLDRGSGGPC